MNEEHDEVQSGQLVEDANLKRVLDEVFRDSSSFRELSSLVVLLCFLNQSFV